MRSVHGNVIAAVLDGLGSDRLASLLSFDLNHLDEAVRRMILPAPDTGNSGRSSNRSGNLNFCNVLRQQEFGQVRECESGAGFRDHKGTAALAVRGIRHGDERYRMNRMMLRIRFSTSSMLIFSPPRLMRSPLRPSA